MAGTVVRKNYYWLTGMKKNIASWLERCRVRARVFAVSTDGERADTLLVGLGNGLAQGSQFFFYYKS